MNQYVTVTAELISIFLCMVSVNVLTYDHNLPQNLIGGEKHS